MIKTIQVKQVKSDDEVAARAGSFVTDKDYSVLITESANVLKPDGEPLIQFRKRAVSQKSASAAYPILLKGARYEASGNRGMAAGRLTEQGVKVGDKVSHRRVGSIEADGFRFRTLKRDGTLGKRLFALHVFSNVMGAMERMNGANLPNCRLTAFTFKNFDALKAASPFIDEVNEVFKSVNPQRYAAQKEVADLIAPEYLIAKTIFSTITLNENFRTALHTDAGDLKRGFGVMSVITQGRYDGGYLVFPKYGVAVDMRNTDVCLADVHEFHANTEMLGKSKYWSRLSCVFYFRAKMVGCKSLDEELEIAKNRKKGQPLYFDFKGEFPE